MTFADRDLRSRRVARAVFFMWGGGGVGGTVGCRSRHRMSDRSSPRASGVRFEASASPPAARVDATATGSTSTPVREPLATGTPRAPAAVTGVTACRVEHRHRRPAHLPEPSATPRGRRAPASVYHAPSSFWRSLRATDPELRLPRGHRRSVGSVIVTVTEAGSRTSASMRVNGPMFAGGDTADPCASTTSRTSSASRPIDLE